MKLYLDEPSTTYYGHWRSSAAQKKDNCKELEQTEGRKASAAEMAHELTLSMTSHASHAHQVYFHKRISKYKMFCKPKEGNNFTSKQA